VSQAPTSFTQLLQAHLWATQTSYEIVIAGKRENQDVRDMVNRLHNTYLPNTVVLINGENNSDLQDLAPYLKNQPAKNGKATAYVCQNYSCKEPTHDAEKMMEMIHPI